MEKGTVIKLTGGLYTVMNEQGETRELRPIGIFRYHDVKLKVGDRVGYDEEAIRTSEPRRNEFLRPHVANVDQVLVVMSAKKPDFSSLLLDMFLAVIRQSDVDPVIVISKIDLMSQEEMAVLESKLAYYRQFCPIVCVDSLNREGIAPIFPLIQGRINVVAGQTGAGKSSLLNAINPLLHLKTDEISEALGRGKHTTRHVELMPFMGGLIADTPGFSKLSMTEFDPKSFKDVYPDFSAVAADCRFLGCVHVHEPGCAVKQAVDSGRILPERYLNYLKLYDEIKHTKTKYPR